MIISIVNRKGSVGKTTTAINLGVALMEAKQKVALLDLDSQGDLTEYAECLKGALWIQSSDEARLLPRGTFVLIDCPPRLEEENAEAKAALAAVALSDIALIPTPPERLGVRGLGRMQDTIESLNRAVQRDLKIQVLVTLYQARIARHREYRDEIKQEFEGHVCATIVPRATAILEALEEESSVLQYAPKSAAAGVYRRLAKEVISWQDA